MIPVRQSCSNQPLGQCRHLLKTANLDDLLKFDEGFIMSMFCYQCEQTAQGTGCNTMGICGKDPDTAALQDLIVNIVKGISCYADAARSLGESNSEVDDVTLEALFMTLTNVNFDEKEHVVYSVSGDQNTRKYGGRLRGGACNLTATA
jgi:hydroxylamine reductase